MALQLLYSHWIMKCLDYFVHLLHFHSNVNSNSYNIAHSIIYIYVLRCLVCSTQRCYIHISFLSAVLQLQCDLVIQHKVNADMSWVCQHATAACHYILYVCLVYLWVFVDWFVYLSHKEKLPVCLTVHSLFTSPTLLQGSSPVQCASDPREHEAVVVTMLWLVSPSRATRTPCVVKWKASQQPHTHSSLPYSRWQNPVCPVLRWPITCMQVPVAFTVNTVFLLFPSKSSQQKQGLASVKIMSVSIRNHCAVCWCLISVKHLLSHFSCTCGIRCCLPIVHKATHTHQHKLFRGTICCLFCL